MASSRIRVRVTPRAGRDQIGRPRDGVLPVRLTAPPVEGKANDGLLRLLAKSLAITPRDLRIVRGASGRDKLIEIDGLDAPEVWLRLARSAGD